jgi:hypothetical protein
VTSARRWGRRKITRSKVQRALDALMALVETCDYGKIDYEDRRSIDQACAALTRMRDTTI